MPFYKGTRRSLRQLAGIARTKLKHQDNATRILALQCVLIAEETCRKLAENEGENEGRSIFAFFSNAMYQWKARRTLHLLSRIPDFRRTKPENMPRMFGSDGGADKQFQILKPGDPRITAAQLLGPF